MVFMISQKELLAFYLVCNIEVPNLRREESGLGKGKIIKKIQHGAQGGT